MKIKSVKCPLYNVMFHICPSFDLARKRFTEFEGNPNWSAQASTLIDPRNGIPCVLVTFSTPGDYCTNTMVHECVHAAWRVLGLVGIEVDRTNHEALAYLAGWMGTEVNNHMVGILDETD